jgi:hypothetical protein
MISLAIPLWDFDVWRRQTALSGYNAFAVTFSEWGHGGRESQLGGVNPGHSPTHKRARGVVKRSIADARESNSRIASTMVPRCYADGAKEPQLPR